MNNYNTTTEYNLITTTLFYKIWKNNYIKGIIIYYIRIYNMFRHKRMIYTAEYDLSKEEAQYYSWVQLHYRDDDENENVKELMGKLSNSVNLIEFKYNGFKKPLNLMKDLPSNITSLKFFKSDYGCPIECNSIPDTIKSLTIDTIKGQIVGKGLTYLEVDQFDSNYSITLPSNLKTFKCNSPMLQSINIDILPMETITNLDFTSSNLIKFKTSSFLSSVDLTKLLNLTSLNLGTFYKDSIKKGSLPNGLKTLILPNDYNVKSNISLGSIPDSVTCLNFKPYYSSIYTMSYRFDWFNKQDKLIKLSSELLPTSLVKLGIGRNHYLSMSPKSNSPSFLKDFKKIIFTGCGCNKSDLPITITKLKYINQSTLPHHSSIVNLTIPTNIQSVTLDGRFIVSNLNQLSSITNLQLLNGDFSHFDYTNLTRLKSLSTIFLQDIETVKQFSNSLECLSIHERGNQPYPESIKILELQTGAPPMLDTELLPSTIHTLIIGGSTSNLLIPISPNIKSIYISSHNTQFINNILKNHFQNNNLLNILKVYNGNSSKTIFNKLTK